MTRKDYILIADAIRDTLTDPEFGLTLPEQEAGGVHRVALELARRLGDENPRFERETFLRACTLRP